MVIKIPDQLTPETHLNLHKRHNGVDLAMERPSLASEGNHQVQIVWRNVLIFLYLHIAAIYGFFIPKSTNLIYFSWFIGYFFMLGITVGAHRYYTHRSFKANVKLRLLFVFMQTVAVQDPIYEWVRNHRVHHKFTDTNADPHNSKRGFFFSHIGWLMCKKHPDVKKFGERIDMSDLKADPIVMFQRKYYIPLAIICGIVLPMSLICVYGESLNCAWHGNIFVNLIFLHIAFWINSGAHLWGYKPFDKSMSATDSILFGISSLGEGWHNYHHVFPWDYKAAELPFYRFNFSLAFIDFFAWIGWATDLKTISDEMIRVRAARTGDGSHTSALKSERKTFESINEKTNFECEKKADFWGWGDKEMTNDDRKCAKILYKFYD